MLPLTTMDHQVGDEAAPDVPLKIPRAVQLNSVASLYGPHAKCRVYISNRAENRLTEMTAAVSSELIFLKHTQCGHSMWPTKTDVPLKGQTKSKSKSECSSRECLKYMHKGCWSTRFHFIEFNLLDFRHIFKYGDPAIIN